MRSKRFTSIVLQYVVIAQSPSPQKKIWSPFSLPPPPIFFLHERQ